MHPNRRLVMPVAAMERTVAERAQEVLRRTGNPFRNYFARNPDDEVCARYHVTELFARERAQLLAVVDLYRHDPTTHSEMIPVLGNKGAGKTHLLHSIKHGADGAWQLLVTPGTYQKHTDRTAAHNTAGLMRRHIYQGFARAALLGDETDLANFLSYGFAELDFKVRPSRQDLVLALFKVLMEIFLSLKIPVVVAFDQLEDLLLVRRNDDGHRIAEAFFAGIVQAMHQIDGLCFLVFAERGLWNRFVPSLDGYIRDRLNNPIHVPQHGTIKALRLEAPPAELVRRVVAARLRLTLEDLPDFAELSAIFPFTPEQ